MGKLPRPISSEPTAFILGLVTSFREDVQRATSGTIDEPALVQGTLDIYRAFQRKIRATAPQFVPFTNKQYSPIDVQKALRLDENDESALSSDLGHREADNLILLQDVRQRIMK